MHDLLVGTAFKMLTTNWGDVFLDYASRVVVDEPDAWFVQRASRRVGELFRLGKTELLGTRMPDRAAYHLTSRVERLMTTPIRQVAMYALIAIMVGVPVIWFIWVVYMVFRTRVTVFMSKPTVDSAEQHDSDEHVYSSVSDFHGC
jgi:hypothetical protein